MILYRGQPVNSIDESLKAAAIAAGLTWGRFVKDGITFHSLRHSVSTLLARGGASADQRGPVTGHADLKMEQWYTHLFPEDERALTETLSAAMPIKTVAMVAGTRATRPRAANSARKPVPAKASSPALKSVAGGLLREGGTPGGLSGPDRPDSVRVRAVSGLRRGPQKRPTVAGSR